MVVQASRTDKPKGGAVPPQLTGKPWLVVGVSKSSWYRMQSQELTPRPVKLPGAGVKYRIDDLLKFVRELKTA